MKVLVDTSVWSLALRRGTPSRDDGVADELRRLVSDYRVAMIGPVRQELLSGIRTPEQYEALRDKLRAFPDLLLRTDDYEVAARFFNACRSRGIQGSSTDFLICAVAAERRVPIFTTNRDFEAYEELLGVSRHGIGD
jgi:hypothetical protein